MNLPDDTTDIINWPFDDATGGPRETPKPDPATELYAAPPRRLLVMLGTALVAAGLGYAWQQRASGHLTAESGWGYAFGVLGAVLMALLALYPLRKKVRLMRRWIPVRHWFAAHILFGTVGPALVVLHANFRLGSINSTVVLGSTLLVAASGYVGLFLYRRLHCDLFEQMAALKALRRESETIREGALFVLGFTPELQDRLIAFEESAVRPTHSLVRALGRVVSVGLRTRTTHLQLLWVLHRTVRAAAARSSWPVGERRRQSKAARVHIRTHLATVRRIAEYRFYERLSALWRLFHLPLFFFMVIAGVLHVIAVHMY